MQDAVGKTIKSVKSLSKKNTTKHLSSSGQELAELVREATGKALHRPDADLNQQVVDLIGSAVHADGPRAVAKILTDRLDQKNAHKVWLAIMLIREVLQKAMKELGPAREDIMNEIEKVASAPMDRFDKNLKDQQSTKHAAFELLKVYGKDGHILSQPQHEREEADRRAQMDRSQGRQNEKGSTEKRHQPDVTEQVRTQLLAIDYQIDLLQELLLDKTEFSAKSQQDQTLAKDVLLEAQKFSQNFERLLGQLSAHDDGSEAQTLMKQSLDKMDILNNSLTLHKEMIKSQAEQLAGKPYSKIVSPRKGGKEGRKDGPSKSPPAREQGSLIDFQDPPAAASTSQSQSHQYGDPFAASTTWQPPQNQAPQPQHQPPPQTLHPQGSYGSQQNPFNSQELPYNLPYQGQHGQPPPFAHHGSYGQQGGYQPYGYNYGGYGQPNYGQPPPNYGTPYQHPPSQNPYYQGPPQWAQHQGGFERPPHQPLPQTSSFPPSAPRPNQPPPYQPIRPQTSLHSQFSTGSDSSQAQQRLPPQQQQQQPNIPIYTADVTIREPQKAESGSISQPPSGSRPENIAATLPVTGVAKHEDIGFGESAFGEAAPTSSRAPQAASPVPPGTPANPQTSSRSAASPPESAEKPSVSKSNGDNGFESSAFGGPTFPAGQQSVAQAVPTGPGNKPEASTKPDDEWDLFFTERSGGGANAASRDTNTAFGDLSLNPPK